MTAAPTPDIYQGFYDSYFVCALVALYFLIRSASFRKLTLLVCSYGIYWLISGKFVVLLFSMSALDFILVSLMLKRPEYRRIALALSIVSNFSVLLYFKYLNFFLDQITPALSRIGLAASEPLVTVVAPVGISFLVFHGVSYSMDAYRGLIRRSPGFLDYLLYIAYFPKILAGPITRATQFMPQLASIRSIPLVGFVSGGELVLRGLFKKIVVAAIFSQYWNELHATKDGGPLLVYAAGACYGLFLLADFSGYTDIARGVSRMLGIELARNFDEPYAATSVSDFWRRWHMSLSFWLRDYLYFPLGGSRRGLPRTIINLMITMVLCGLWHGAAWTFILWGFIHGAVMSLERIVRVGMPDLRVAAPLRLCATWIIISLMWILFASADLQSAGNLLGRFFEFRGPVSREVVLICLATIALGPLASYFGIYRRLFDRTETSNAFAFAINSIMVAAILFQLWRGADVNEFVYFRF